jgi:hypothetical protein
LAAWVHSRNASGFRALGLAVLGLDASAEHHLLLNLPSKPKTKTVMGFDIRMPIGLLVHDFWGYAGAVWPLYRERGYVPAFTRD